MNRLTHLSNGELAVGLIAIFVILYAVVRAFLVWLLKGPITPDPWDAEVAAQMADEESKPLCHRCLAPHDGTTDFCSECGAPVGQYTNWLPFPYLFSLGHTLRIGTSGDFRRTPLTVAFFVLVSLAEYMLLAPVYWFFFFRRDQRAPAEPLAPEPARPE